VFGEAGTHRTTQRIVELQVAMAVRAQGRVVDVAMLIGEVRAVQAYRQTLVVVFNPFADTPANGCDLLPWLPVDNRDHR
jgi:hypothetical protein